MMGIIHQIHSNPAAFVKTYHINSRIVLANIPHVSEGQVQSIAKQGTVDATVSRNNKIFPFMLLHQFLQLADCSFLHAEKAFPIGASRNIRPVEQAVMHRRPDRIDFLIGKPFPVTKGNFLQLVTGHHLQPQSSRNSPACSSRPFQRAGINRPYCTNPASGSPCPEPRSRRLLSRMPPGRFP